MNKTSDLVEVPCNLCGSKDTELLYEKEGLDTVRCTACGLAYINPRLSSEAIRALYEEEFYTQSEGRAGCDCFKEDSTRYDHIRFKADLGVIERHRPGRGKLLDVGCGLGRFVAFARERGWDAEGIDFSTYSTAFAAKQGLPVKCGKLGDAGYAAASFDVVTMFHVLEHLEDPLRFLSKEVRPLLKPGGLLMIEIPNFGSKDSIRLKGEWVWARPKEHLYGFTLDTLGKLAAKAGFAMVEIMAKSAMTFGGQVQDPGQIAAYRKMSESRLGRGIKDRIRGTPLWGLVRGTRQAMLNLLRPFKKIEAGDMEILCVARKTGDG